MAGGFSLRLDAKGLGRLARTLKQAGADMGDLKAAYKRAAEVVKPEVKDLTPVRSGRLRRTIRTGATQKAGVVRAMGDLKAAYKRAAEVVKPEVKDLTPVRSGRLRRTIRTGATQKAGVVRAGNGSVVYAGVINYGWPGHHIEPKWFMQDGLISAEAEVDGIFADAMDKAIQQIKGA